MINIQNLAFSYTKAPFIEDVNFSVEKGEIFGFLGPSGAGKSTIQKILIGILPQYSGSVVVNGIEIRNRTNQFYEQIGVDFEYPSLYEKLTGRENLRFFASLYSGAKNDIDTLLKSVELLQDADKKVSEYSKGMKSRLNFIKSMVHKPSILFLDEPTSGLDPTNARVMKDLILKEKENGTTIILTTHNMEDASELCDQVAFIVNGKIKAMDSPHNLIMQKGAVKVTYSYSENGSEKTKESLLHNTASDEMLQTLIRENRLLTIHSSEPKLGDIFIEITGRQLI